MERRRENWKELDLSSLNLWVPGKGFHTPSCWAQATALARAQTGLRGPQGWGRLPGHPQCSLSPWNHTEWRLKVCISGGPPPLRILICQHGVGTPLKGLQWLWARGPGRVTLSGTRRVQRLSPTSNAQWVPCIPRTLAFQRQQLHTGGGKTLDLKSN